MPAPDAPAPNSGPVPLCECCRRPRADLAPGAPCPECGVTPSGFPPVPFVPTPRACAGCGYSIDQLNPTSLCPECGMPIQQTLQGDGLHLADPLYLERVASGTMWITWTTILSVSATVLAMCVPPLIIIPLIAAPLAIAAGAWLMNTRDARYPEDAARFAKPRLARIAAAAVVVFELLTLALEVFDAGNMFTGPSSGPSDPFALAKNLAWLFMLLAFLLMLFFTAEHVRRTAKRMRRKALERLAAINSLIWALCFACEVAFAIVSAFDTELAPVCLILIVPAALAGFVVGLIALYTFSTALTQARDRAASPKAGP